MPPPFERCSLTLLFLNTASDGTRGHTQRAATQRSASCLHSLSPRLSPDFEQLEDRPPSMVNLRPAHARHLWELIACAEKKNPHFVVNRGQESEPDTQTSPPTAPAFQEKPLLSGTRLWAACAFSWTLLLRIPGLCS